jgi:RNA polymerase sigma-70 factor (ECF subfamily)
MAAGESAGGNEDAAVPGERELLALVARRDRRAFTELYRRYQPRLLAYLYRLLSNAALADEIVDDVLFVVWQDAKKFRGTSAVSSWIFGIAYRKSMTVLRRELRYQKPLDRDADIGRLPALSRADTEFVHAGLTALSADHRQVVELTYFCGFSYQEIAEIADCPVNTVKTRMFHARRRLKTLLPELAGDAVKPGREHG